MPLPPSSSSTSSNPHRQTQYRPTTQRAQPQQHPAPTTPYTRVSSTHQQQQQQQQNPPAASASASASTPAATPSTILPTPGRGTVPGSTSRPSHSTSRTTAAATSTNTTLNPNSYSSNSTTSHNSNIYSNSASNINSSNRTRQLSHLQARLAQLGANVADLEQLLAVARMQAGGVRDLGGICGGLLVGGGQVLGERERREG